MFHWQGTGLENYLVYTGFVDVIRKNEQGAEVVVIKGGKRAA